MRRPLPLLLLLLAGLAAVAAACFSPLQPACTFACGPSGACPEKYTCESDGLCHRADGQGQCDLESGGSPSDGAAD
jgi:hypothetical protein